MDLRAAGRSQRNLAISSWDLVSGAWVSLTQRGNLSAGKVGVAVDEATKQRTLLCSPGDQLPNTAYRLLIDGCQYLIESEQKNSWRGGAYQYVYQLRVADKAIDIYHLVATVKASGLPGAAVRTLLSGTAGGVVFASDLQSSKLEAVDYTRAKVFLPGDMSLSTDYELVIDNESYDVATIRKAQRVLVAECLRR